MARIQVAFRRHGKIFMAGATSFHSFDHAGPLLEVDHKVEKVKAPGFLVSSDILKSKLFILSVQGGKILTP